MIFGIKRLVSGDMEIFASKDFWNKFDWNHTKFSGVAYKTLDIQKYTLSIRNFIAIFQISKSEDFRFQQDFREPVWDFKGVADPPSSTSPTCLLTCTKPYDDIFWHLWQTESLAGHIFLFEAVWPHLVQTWCEVCLNEFTAEWLSLCCGGMLLFDIHLY